MDSGRARCVAREDSDGDGGVHQCLDYGAADVAGSKYCDCLDCNCL